MDSTVPPEPDDRKVRPEFGSCLKTFIALFGVGMLFGFVFYPVVMQERAYTKLQTCQSNLKQIGLALAQYSQDYDQHLPLVRSTGAGTKWASHTPSYGWLDSIEPYSDEYDSRFCPSDPYAQDPERTIPPDTHGCASYYFNTNLNARPKNHFHSAVEGLDIEQLSAPNKTLLLGEGSDGDARYSRTATEHRQRSVSWFSSDTPDTRHMNGGNYAFCDGHVKFLRPDQISQGATGTSQAPDKTSLSATFAPY